MIGELCALAAALTWSVSVILFKRSERADTVTPLGMNLFKNVVAMVLLFATMGVLWEGVQWDRSQEDWIRLVVSGVLGIAVADTLIFMALKRLGAGLLAVVDCAYAPVTVLFSVLVLGEALWASFLLGAALVVGGVLITSTGQLRPEEQDGTRPPLRWGVVLGVLGIVAMALGIVLAKPALASGHLVEVTSVRLVAGVLAQAVWIALLPGQRSALGVFRDRSSWKTLIPASILGTYVAMLFWLGGFKWAPVNVAAVLNQLASAFTVILAWIFLHERLTKPRAFGTALAVGGAVLILLTRPDLS